MSDNYFKVFKNSEDHYRWHKQKEYAAIADGLDETTRKNLMNALDTLEQTLGKNFLKSSDFNHPVRQMVIEKTEFQIYELIDFADTLRMLGSSNSNFPKLQKKLLRKDKSKKEGIPFVEIAQSYLHKGFIVDFPEEDNKGKSPDIKIIDHENDNVFYIEVSTLNDGPDRINKRNNHYFFHDRFHYNSPHYPFVGVQKEIIEEDDYPEIKKIISEAKRKVDDHKQIVYYSDRRFFFLITPSIHIKELETICEKYSLQLNDIRSLPLNFDETSRIVNNKIKNEADQIPIGFNGLIYFPVSPLYFMTTDIETTIERIEHYLSNFKNIIGIVIYSKIVNACDEKAIDIKKHRYRRKVIKNLSCESLYIHNNNCELLISAETVKKVLTTF